MDSNALGSLFLERARGYLMTEYRTKLRCAVEALPPETLWQRPNESSNSVGNLVLHLIGSSRQWIVSGVGGVPDTRKRAAEFEARDGLPAAELMAEVERTLVEMDRVLSALDPSTLLERRVIQGNDLTLFEAVLSVIQHFSHHVGQVIWIAKMHAPGSIRFVEGDADGLTRSLWRNMIRPPAI